jgi:hypothetical protein
MPKMTAPRSRADRRAVAAGEQAAADDGGDDRLELLLEAAAGVGRAGIEHGEDGDQRCGASGQHEQRVVLTMLTGTPELRAAFGSPPAAKTQLPKRVRKSASRSRPR